MPECNVTKRERVDFEGVGDGRFRGGRGGFAGNGDGWVAAACAGLTAQPLTLLSFSFAAQKAAAFLPLVYKCSTRCTPAHSGVTLLLFS